MGGGLGSSIVKQNYVESLLVNNDLTVLTIIEAEIAADQDPPKILNSDYEIFAENKKRLITYYKRKSGLIPQETGNFFQMPVHLLHGREITYAAVYSEFKAYDGNDEIVESYDDKAKRIKILNNTIKQIHGMSKRMTYIAGDVNLDWNTPGTPHMDNYKKTIQKLGLKQQIHRITHPRVGRMRRGTTIDHILSKNMEGKFYVFPCEHSDHHGVGYTNAGYQRISQQKTKKIKNVNYNKDTLKYAFDTYPYHNPDHNFNNLEVITDQTMKWMKKVQEKATSYTIKKPSQPEWWRPWLLKYKARFEANPDDDVIKKDYRNAIIHAHRIHDAKTKKTKGHPFRKDKPTDIAKLVIEGKECEDDKSKANALAKTFDNKVKTIIEQSSPDFKKLVEDFTAYNKDRGIKTWEFNPPTKSELRRLIRKLPNKKSHGIDDLPYTLLKHVQNLAIKPIFHIFRLVFEEERVLDRWLTVVVTGIYKKGNPEDPLNYRPVSLGQLMLRLIEKWIALEMGRVSKEQPLLPECMHGFNAGKSTESCLIAVTEHAKSLMSKKRKSAMVLLDATAAFDALPRELILAVMEALGCGNSSLNILKSYLRQKWTMKVKVGDELSEEFESREGVIQGGGASANLYCFTSSIIEFALRGLGEMFFYADDSCVIVDAETEEELNEKIETTINKITEVFMKLGLTINQKKSEIMPMKGTKTRKEFMVKDFKCKPCKEIVFLGACIQSDLGVKGQVDRVLSKMQKAIYKVNQQRFNRQGRERAAMIQAYVMSHLHYARNYWLPKTTANMRHKLQVRINRVIETSLNKRTKIRTGTKTILRRMTLPSLRAKYKIKDVEMVFEDTLLEKAKIIATEKAESRNPNNIKRHKVKPVRGDTKGNYLRRIWNNVPMHHLVMHTKNPKESYKRWSKKVYMLIFEATYQLGSLPRPPEGSDGYKQLIPLKWRLDMIGNLSHVWHERLRRTKYIQYQNYRYREN